MSNITLASLAILSSQKELSRHRKQFPCQFECVIEIGSKKDGITFRRYHSMIPAVLYGELIKTTHQLNSDQGRCVYIERLDSNSWYGATFDNGELLYEFVEPFEQLMQTLAYDCHKSASIFSPTDADDVLVHSEKVVQVDPVNMALIGEYQLSRIDNYLPVKIMGGVAALVVGVFVLAYLFMPKQSQSVTVNEPINLTTQFIQTYGTNLSASNTLINAIHLLAETAFLPPPMKGDAVTLSNRSLVVSVTKNGVSEKIWQQWLTNKPTLNAFYNDTNSTTGSFSYPLSHQLTWQSFTMERYLPSLLDALKRLGITVSDEKPKQIGDITSHSMTLTMTDNISKLLVLLELIDNSAITTNALTLTRTSINEFTLSLSLSIHGVNHGN
jgi:hypothetical protein